MPVVCAEFAQFLSITCSKRGRSFFWEDLTFLSSIFALPRCSSCFSPDSLSPSNTRQSSFLYHDCFSMWMPFWILDITCETWKIVILNYGFMVLAGHWPQTKALIIWGLRREQEVGRLPADNNQWEEGWNRTTRLQLGPGEVDGNTHESGRALSQLLALLVAYVRILEASQEFLTFRVLDP